ncbi:MAG: hypothetical protein ACNA8R_09310 [Nitriliruptoraceae bacterium]
MSDDTFPTVRITATDRHRFEVELPGGDGTQVPSLPEELRGEDIPSFVLEWIAESDEIGLIIQELLQAPTKSLCRIFRVPTYDAKTQLSTPTFSVSPITFPSDMWRSVGDVSGFGMDEAPPDTVPGLPEGVQLPIRLLELIAMTKRLDAWIEKGWRVRAWAEEHGHGDAPWLPAAL